MKTKSIAFAGLVGALYAALTIVMAPISYGPVQVRLAESLTVLPYLFPQTIPGLFFGCMAANIFGGFGLLDIFFGSFLTLVAAIFTRWAHKLSIPWLAPLPPVVLNAFGIALILYVVLDVPYWLTVLQIGIGQFISCYVLGLPLLFFLSKRKHIIDRQQYPDTSGE